MGADLYIEPFYSENQKKYDKLFHEAVDRRNANKPPKEVTEIIGQESYGMTLTPEQMTVKIRVYPKEYALAKKLQADVDDLYEKMSSVGYFRDSYNDSSLFWKLGLSWWQGPKFKGKPLINSRGNISVESAKALRKLVVKAKIEVGPDEHKKWQPGMTQEKLQDFFEKKRMRFIEFLDLAIKNRRAIHASV